MAAKQGPLHLAKSMKELNAKVSAQKLTGNSVKMLGRSSEKLFLNAKDRMLEGDMEMSYVLFMRYLEVVKTIKDSKDYKTNKKLYGKLIDASRFMQALNEAERISAELQKRYEALSNGTDDSPATSKKPKMSEEDSGEGVLPVASGNSNSDQIVPQIGKDILIPSKSDDALISTVSPDQLYGLLTEQPDQTIVLDCRKRSDYTSSHVDGKKYPMWLSIAEEAVRKGNLAIFLTSSQSKLWHDKASRRHIVLVDSCSTADTISSKHSTSSTILALRDSLTKWNTQSSCATPVILQGGYDAWHLAYAPLCVGKWQRKGTELQKKATEPKIDIIENGFETNGLDYPSFPDISAIDQFDSAASAKPKLVHRPPPDPPVAPPKTTPTPQVAPPAAPSPSQVTPSTSQVAPSQNIPPVTTIPIVPSDLLPLVGVVAPLLPPAPTPVVPLALEGRERLMAAELQPMPDIYSRSDFQVPAENQAPSFPETATPFHPQAQFYSNGPVPVPAVQQPVHPYFTSAQNGYPSTAQPTQYAPQHTTTQVPHEYANEVTQYGNGAMQYGNGNSQYQNGPAQYQNGPEQYRNEPVRYSNGGPQYQNESAVQYQNESAVQYQNESAVQYQNTTLQSQYRNEAVEYQDESAQYRNQFQNQTSPYQNEATQYQNRPVQYQNESSQPANPSAWDHSTTARPFQEQPSAPTAHFHGVIPNPRTATGPIPNPPRYEHAVQLPTEPPVQPPIPPPVSITPSHNTPSPQTTPPNTSQSGVDHGQPKSTTSPGSSGPSAENTTTTTNSGSLNSNKGTSSSNSVETPVVNVETPLETNSGKDEIVVAATERAKEKEANEEKERVEEARRVEERRLEEKRREDERRRAELAEKERSLEEKERQLQEQISAQTAKGVQDMQQQMHLMLAEGRQQLDRDREQMMRELEAERERQRAQMAQELQEMKAAYEKQHSAMMKQEGEMRGYWEERRQQEQHQQAGPARVYTSQGLPQGWEKRLDKVTGRFYYIDHATKTTHWNPPTAMLQYQRQQQQQQQQQIQQQLHDAQLRPQPSRPTTTVTPPSPAQPPPTQPGVPPPQKSPPTPQSLTKPTPTQPQPQSNPPRNLPTVDRNAKPTHLVKPSSQVARPAVNRAVKPMPNELLQRKMLNLRPTHGGGSGLTGMHNLGNTCFMNSILQCLLSTGPLVQYFITNKYRADLNRGNLLGSGGVLAEEFFIVCRAVWLEGYRSIYPREFKDTLAKFAPYFTGTSQQDCQEFMMYLLDGLHEDLNKVLVKEIVEVPSTAGVPDHIAARQAWQAHLKRNNSIIVDKFNGMFRSSITCLTCHHQNIMFEPFSCLSVPIPRDHNSCSYVDCIRQLTQKERLSGENKWHCPRCKTFREAEKSLSIWSLPPLLLLHFKRFKTRGMWREKINTHITYPLQNLDMSPFVVGPKPSKSYNLYAVSLHTGTVDGGHYTACTYHSSLKKFHYFSDQVIREASTGDLKSSSSYVLFYTNEDFKPMRLF